MMSQMLVVSPRPMNFDEGPELQGVQREVSKEINNAFSARNATIQGLREIAAIADHLSKQQGQANIPVSGLNVLGGALVIGSGVATIATAEAAAPVLAGYLATAGAATGLGGGAWSVWNTKQKVTQDVNLRAQLRELLKNDTTAMLRLEHILQRVLNGSMEDPDVVFRILHTFGMCMQPFLTVWDAEKAVGILKDILPALTEVIPETFSHVLSTGVNMLSKLITEVAEESAKELADEIAIKAADRAVRNSTAGFARHFARQAAREAAEEAATSVLEKGAEKALKKGSKEITEEITKKEQKRSPRKQPVKLQKRL